MAGVLVLFRGFFGGGTEIHAGRFFLNLAHMVVIFVCNCFTMTSVASSLIIPETPMRQVLRMNSVPALFIFSLIQFCSVK